MSGKDSPLQNRKPHLTVRFSWWRKGSLKRRFIVLLIVKGVLIVSLKCVKINQKISRDACRWNFNRVEFDAFRREVVHSYFAITHKKRIVGVNAIGIVSRVKLA